MRDDKWLFQRLDHIWDEYFSDIPQHNNVKIVWGRKAKNRLGSIKQAPTNKISILNSKIKNKSQIKNLKIEKRNFPDTIITINSLFKHEEIPDFVVDATIAHELAHYAHGFHSPLERKFKNPHEGGVVHRELDERGLGKMIKSQKKWWKENWKNFLEREYPECLKPRKAKRRIVIRWNILV